MVGRENTENNSLARIYTGAVSSDTLVDCRPVPQRLELLLGSSPHSCHTPTPEGFVSVETVNTYFQFYCALPEMGLFEVEAIQKGYPQHTSRAAHRCYC